MTAVIPHIARGLMLVAAVLASVPSIACEPMIGCPGLDLPQTAEMRATMEKLGKKAAQPKDRGKLTAAEKKALSRIGITGRRYAIQRIRLTDQGLTCVRVFEKTGDQLSFEVSIGAGGTIITGISLGFFQYHKGGPIDLLNANTPESCQPSKGRGALLVKTQLKKLGWPSGVLGEVDIFDCGDGLKNLRASITHDSAKLDDGIAVRLGQKLSFYTRGKKLVGFSQGSNLSLNTADRPITLEGAITIEKAVRTLRYARSEGQLQSIPLERGSFLSHGLDMGQKGQVFEPSVIAARNGNAALVDLYYTPTNNTRRQGPGTKPRIGLGYRVGKLGGVGPSDPPPSIRPGFCSNPSTLSADQVLTYRKELKGLKRRLK